MVRRAQAHDFAQRPIVRVHMPVGRPSAVQAYQITHLAVALLSAIDAVEASGRRVELSLVDRGDRHLYQDHYEITIKRASEAWNVRSVAAALHPAIGRRLGFRMVECASLLADRRVPGGYGRHMDAADKSVVALQWTDSTYATSIEKAQSVVAMRFAAAGVRVTF